MIVATPSSGKVWQHCIALHCIDINKIYIIGHLVISGVNGYCWPLAEQTYLGGCIRVVACGSLWITIMQLAHLYINIHTIYMLWYNNLIVIFVQSNEKIVFVLKQQFLIKPCESVKAYFKSLHDIIEVTR